MNKKLNPNVLRSLARLVLERGPREFPADRALHDSRPAAEQRQWHNVSPRGLGTAGARGLRTLEDVSVPLPGRLLSSHDWLHSSRRRRVDILTLHFLSPCGALSCAAAFWDRG